MFVFPSATDTLVLLEAMASGVTVAAFPVTGPEDVVEHGRTGILDWDLKRAVLAALELDPASALEFARSRSWAQASAQFASLLTPVLSSPG